MIRKFCDLCDAPAAPIEFGKGVWVHRGDLKFDVPIGIVAVNKCHGRTLRPEDFDLCQSCLEKIVVDFMGEALGKKWVRKDSLDNVASRASTPALTTWNP